MFPDAQQTPSKTSKGCIYKPVAPPVAVEFCLPKVAIVDGQSCMLRTPVPETAVNEDDDPPRTEVEIRLAEEGGVPPPTGDAKVATKCYGSFDAPFARREPKTLPSTSVIEPSGKTPTSTTYSSTVIASSKSRCPSMNS